jgi:hypothetical protein
MKYYFIEAKVYDGEHQHFHKIVIELPGKVTIEKAEDIAVNLFRYPDMQADCVKLRRFCEISKEHFNILEQYI